MIKRAVVPPNWADTGNPVFAAELAAAAEESGWDGYFTWDGLLLSDDPPPVFDPFVLLAAVAAATDRITIGTCILVPARYPPHLLAMRLASLDVLSGGRLVVGVGLGDGGATFERFGADGSVRSRAERLDESLAIMTRLWAGEKLVHDGRHYTVDGYVLATRPIQQPRIPIWVGGDSAGALRRAARWDGWIGPDEDPTAATTDDLAAVVSALAEEGRADLDIAWAGTGPDLGSMADAGATWWITPLIGDRDTVMQRVLEGPPTA